MKDLSFVNTILDTITDLTTTYEVGAGKAPSVLYVGDLEMKALDRAVILMDSGARTRWYMGGKKTFQGLHVIETTQFSFLKVGE